MTPEWIRVFGGLAEARPVLIAESSEPPVLVGPGALDSGQQALILRILRGHVPLESRRAAEYLWAIQERCAPRILPELKERIAELTADQDYETAECLPPELWKQVIVSGDLTERETKRLRLSSHLLADSVKIGMDDSQVRQIFQEQKQGYDDAQSQIELHRRGYFARCYGDMLAIEELLETAVVEQHHAPRHYLEHLVTSLQNSVRNVYAQLALSRVFGSIVSAADDESWRSDLMPLFPWHLLRLVDVADYPNYLARPNLQDVEKATLIEMLAPCRNLETLNISGANKLGDQGLFALLDALPNLKRINVKGCSVSDEALSAVVRQRSSLRFCRSEAELMGCSLSEWHAAYEECQAYFCEQGEEVDADYWRAYDIALNNA